MRLLGSERIANVVDRCGAEEGEVITHGLVTKSIGRAQGKVEMNNFESRKRSHPDAQPTSPSVIS
jgi:preprotein translocase subunit SecA